MILPGTTESIRSTGCKSVSLVISVQYQDWMSVNQHHIDGFSEAALYLKIPLASSVNTFILNKAMLPASSDSF